MIDRSRELVQLNIRNLPRRERAEFKLWCLQNEVSMQDALRQLMQRVCAGEIKIHAEN